MAVGVTGGCGLLQVYQSLAEQLGINDESMLLNVFVRKM